ncbi:MAG: hypothetical protein WAN65_09645 [Candidatus Sulfotelmatobacter sp.]
MASFLQIVILVGAALGQSTLKQSLLEPTSATVPLTLDHNRILIDVDVTSSNGATQHVHAWVDNGNADLEMSRRFAALLGLTVMCGDKTCSAPPPAALTIGTMKIPLSGIQEVKIPLKQESGASVMAPGVNAEINISSAVLRNYDVLISFPDHKFTIGQPGSLKFNGVKSKMLVNASNGIIEIPSEIDNKKYNLGLDVGSSISFLSAELFDKLSAAHPGWPHMTGAVGPANMWGAGVEAKWNVLRIERVQYGPLFLSGAPVVSLPQETLEFFEKRAGVSTVGVLGSEALLNYRVGLDYAHSTAYFDIGRTFNFPDFDVIGLILRPEDDGRFTILGAADFDGKASVPEVQEGDHLVGVDGTPVQGSTMGQVWLMLGGAAGQERTLTIKRSGEQFTVSAKVQHFLGEVEDDSDSKRKSHKN